MLAEAWGAPVSVDGLRRLSGGASRDTWSLDARRGDGPAVPLVAQRLRDGPLRRPGWLAVEAELLRAAATSGVPVADVVTVDDDMIVLSRIDGETIPRKLLRDDEFAAVRPQLAAACGSALAAVHRIPLGAVPTLAASDPLAEQRAVLDAVADVAGAHPTFELALRWLAAERKPSARTTVVHGDFRNGNLVVGPDGLRAVLDWELAHVGDPMEDLGWLCAKAWRFGAAPPVGGFGEYADLFAAYEEASGVAVEPEVVRWWEVFASLRWGVICIVQAATHLSGAARSVELATIGRRVCETEWDLLELLP